MDASVGGRESRDDGHEKGEEGHEKAKKIKNTRRKWGEILGKEGREKEGRKENGWSVPHLFSCLTVTENHSVHRINPLFFIFPRSSLISFVACFEYKLCLTTSNIAKNLTRGRYKPVSIINAILRPLREWSTQ